MYVMVQLLLDQFEDIVDDMDFTQKLLNEEMVYVLPGECFAAPNFFRVVFCAPLTVLEDACDRMERFCKAHAKKTPNTSAVDPS